MSRATPGSREAGPVRVPQPVELSPRRSLPLPMLALGRSDAESRVAFDAPRRPAPAEAPTNPESIAAALRARGRGGSSSAPSAGLHPWAGLSARPSTTAARRCVVWARTGCGTTRGRSPFRVADSLFRRGGAGHRLESLGEHGSAHRQCVAAADRLQSQVLLEDASLVSDGVKAQTLGESAAARSAAPALAEGRYVDLAWWIRSQSGPLENPRGERPLAPCFHSLLRPPQCCTCRPGVRRGSPWRDPSPE